jgi:hypothetical protein
MIGVAAPAALAAWSPATGWADEPSTTFDDAAHMWQAPNAAAVDKVYFAGTFSSARKLVAALGFWRDCNGDGFIGLRLTGQREYDPALSNALGSPVNAVVCPVGSAYNSGVIVDEFREIGPNPTDEVPDSNAKVWADWDLPGAPYYGPGSKTSVDDRLFFNPSTQNWEGSVTWSAPPGGTPAPGGIILPTTSPGSGNITFYADVEAPAATGAGQLPSGDDAFTYGVEQCAAIGAGQPIWNGWNCDPSRWNANAFGPGTPVVGQKYDLRDADSCVFANGC